MTYSKYLSYLFVCTVLAVFLFSCNKKDKEIMEKLTMLEQLVDQNPDSVLMILDSIVYPNDLNEGDYNKYLLLQIQAKDKLYKDITGDTVILQIKDYYLGKSDIDNATIASFYSGRVFHEQGKKTAAMEEYLTADKYASQIKNINWYRRLGRCV